ncbi:MAG: preprotein translocase subunit SecG [Gemmatimonadetes bacterium]|nr:preprotein translocase subunit SecG [Gemmatimonadota bacterium]
MFTFLLVLLLLDGLLLTVIVLLQSSKGDGLAAMGGASVGTDSFIGGRQAATLLTKSTWVTGGLFLGIAFVLSILSSRQERPRSILRDQFQQTAPASQPAIPGVQPANPPASAPQGAAPAPAGQATPAQPAPSAPAQPKK